MSRVRETILSMALVLLVLGASQSPVRAEPLSKEAVSLSLAVLPPTLPADGGSYPAVLVSLLDPSGRPTVASNDTTVMLTSAQRSVGTVEAHASIHLGGAYGIVNFTTTLTPGTTSVTASALGLRSATAAVRTATATGYPTRLKISAVPAQILARPSSSGLLILELLDEGGLPAKAISDFSVSLYSSNALIADLPLRAVPFSAGEVVELVNYTSGFVPGSATVAASAQGLISGSTSVSVLGSPPLALKLFAQPSNIVTCGAPVLSCAGRLVLGLTDLSGNPTGAPADIAIDIKSSNLSVVAPAARAVIKAGEISAVTSYAATTVQGTATIAASSPGLRSDFATVTTYRPVALPQSLKVFVGPNPVLADHSSYGSAVVELVTAAGLPTVNPDNDTAVTLTSSATSIGNFSSTTLRIPHGSSFAVAQFTSTFLVGSTTVTASANNLLPSQAVLTSFGPVPSRVVLTALSRNLPADGQAYPALEAELEDSSGSPAVAPFDIPLNLASSQSGIASVEPAVIRSGQSFAVVQVTTGVLPGAANITAFQSPAPGVTISSVTISTVVPSPSKLVPYLASPALMTREASQGPVLAMQLQDATGNPARARELVTITVTPSNTTVLDRLVSTSMGIGRDVSFTRLSPSSPGSTLLTISSPGLETSSVNLGLIPYPLQISVLPQGKTIYDNQTAQYSLEVLLAGKPLGGVPVAWSASSGQIVTKNLTTDRQGRSTALYSPAGKGLVTVTAAIKGLALGYYNTTSTLNVLAAPKVSHSLVDLLLSFPYVLAIPGAAVAAVATFFFIKRKSRKEGEEEQEEAAF